MFDKYEYMRERFPRYIGDSYAIHLVARLNWNDRFDRNSVTRSLEAYFKAKKREYWEKLESYCEKNRIPWHEGMITLNMMQSFDKVLTKFMRFEGRFGDVRRINEVFASPESLAKALGTTYVSPEPVVKVKASPSGNTPVSCPSQACSHAGRGFLPSQAGFWEDWDYE
ncbi:MAG: hypothetical protein EOM02_04660 [Synergistales bacterium]|nr:hypothetical protein [Synergistales bacterium]